MSSPYNDKSKQPNEKEIHRKALDKLYEDGKFNHVGGKFKPGRPVRSNYLSIGLPDKYLDRHRLRQKDLRGRTFDHTFGSYMSGPDLHDADGTNYLFHNQMPLT